MQNGTADGGARPADQEVFLSDILDSPVMANGKKIGALSDLVIVETAKIPEVRSLYVTRSFGKPSLLVPWEKVTGIAGRRIAVTIEDTKLFEAEPADDAILLRDYVLDKKVLDLEENEVEVVYDIRLVLRNQKFYVVDVETGRAAMLRRLGLGFLAKILYSSAGARAEQIISWMYIQPLPSHISSFKGDVKLKILKETLAEIHPVDLADILEELDHDQRVAVFSSLDVEQASDTLEEIEPSIQRDIISSLSKEQVVGLLNDMTPGQAADVLAALPSADTQTFLAAVNPENARKVRAILEKQEEKVIHYTTQKFLKFGPETTVEYVQNNYPNLARGKDVIMYVYVVDPQDFLLGVIDLKELLLADDRALLKDVMVENVISLSTESTLKEASQNFARYDFRALPVTDATNRLAGVIPYRDVMNLTNHFLE